MTLYNVGPRDESDSITGSSSMNATTLGASHKRTDAYEPIAGAILIVETPDWGPADLMGLPYRNVPPGIYPITMDDVTELGV